MNPLNVYLVDNDQHTLTTYRTHLEEKGYRNITVLNCQDKCVFNINDRPDIVFMGNSIGQKCGLELLHSFKSVDPNIDVILLPGPGQRGHFEPNRSADTIEMGTVDNYVLDYMVNVLTRLSMIRKFVRKTA